MLKDIFTETKTVQTHAGKKKIRIANTTGDTMEEVSVKALLDNDQVRMWVNREENTSTGWKLEDEPFSTVFTLARVLRVPIDALLTPYNADRYRWHVQNYPTITAMEETRKKSCDYLTPQDLANRLGISAKTVIRLIERGEIVAIHIGHRYLIQVTDAVKYLNEHQTAKRK